MRIEAQNDDQGGDERQENFEVAEGFPGVHHPRRLEGADLLGRLADLRRHQPLGNLPFPGLLHLLEKGEGIGDVVPQLRIFFLQPPGDLFQAGVEKGPLQTAENQIGDEKKAANGVEKSQIRDFFLKLKGEIASEDD